MTKALKSGLRSGLLLAIIAVGGVTLLAAIKLLTEERIAEQERLAALQQLEQVLPGGRYDNDLLSDRVSIPEKAARNEEALLVYRARRDGEPVAAVLRIVAPDGYNGDIVLLVGIYTDGSISGVRVLSHRETPGLGDPIEIRRSDWIRSFTGRSLGDPPAERWAVKRDGGDFDQFTGATITPRAVTGAVRRALEYYQGYRDQLFVAPSGAMLEAIDDQGR